MDTDAGTWFLSRAERGNLATDVHAGGAGSPSWSEGNLVRPLIHGATYFARLHEELTALQPGDRVWFTDWRGDADERLLADGPSIGDLLARLGPRGSGGAGPGLAIPRRARVGADQRPIQRAPRSSDQRRRRRGAAGSAGAPVRLPSPEALRHPPS